MLTRIALYQPFIFAIAASGFRTTAPAATVMVDGLSPLGIQGLNVSGRGIYDVDYVFDFGFW